MMTHGWVISEITQHSLSGLGPVQIFLGRHINMCDRLHFTGL